MDLLSDTGITSLTTTIFTFLTLASSADDGSTGGGMSYPLAQYPTLIRTTASGTAKSRVAVLPSDLTVSLVSQVRSQALAW